MNFKKILLRNLTVQKNVEAQKCRKCIKKKKKKKKKCQQLNEVHENGTGQWVKWIHYLLDVIDAHFSERLEHVLKCHIINMQCYLHTLQAHLARVDEPVPRKTLCNIMLLIF
jgi:hypothetical protein